MILLLGLRELQWSRRRFAVAVLATALVFALGLLMSGVSASFDNEIDRTVDSFGADAWLVRGESFGPVHRPGDHPGVAGRGPCARLPGVRPRRPRCRAARDDHDAEPPERQPARRRARRRGLAARLAGRSCSRDAARRSRTRASASSVGDVIDLNGRSLRVGAVTRGQTYFAGIPTVTVSLREAQALALDGRPLATAIVTRGRPAAAPHRASPCWPTTRWRVTSSARCFRRSRRSA